MTCANDKPRYISVHVSIVKMIHKFLLILFIGIGSANAQAWQAKWITCKKNNTTANSFFAYRKQVNLSQVPGTAMARISVDTKYWLWINDKLVVFEGGLKRGPNPKDTYYDEVNIAPFLTTGNNIISVLVWYFGKEGFSHKNSGKAAMIFDCQASPINIISDASWQCSWLPAYQTAPDPVPNFRLPESSVLFDATKDIGKWQTDLSITLDQAVEAGTAGDLPWGQLIKRPIPFWKDYGLKNYPAQSSSSDNTNTTIIASLPYNAQVTPYFKIDAPEAGQKITVCTDNYLFYDGSATGIRFEYITKKGIQEFELPGWINGHKVYYIMTKGISLLEAKFRETGYNAEFDGSFTCSDPFFNKLWQKAARSLYVNMRDGYMDCPDRERAQWAGDAVHESAEAFYALSPSSNALSKKWLNELLNWQKSDGSLYAPVPAGNNDIELPDQTLSAIGYYGLWNYYMHTGDLQTLSDFYPAIKHYFVHWVADDAGMIKSRNVFPFWGDRTDNKDTRLIVDALYYMTMKCVQQAALVLNNKTDYDEYTLKLKNFSDAFNQKFWNGKAYRDPDYTGLTDDRAQALAVLAGIADKAKYPAILDILKKEEHASTYMEKYVTEALFVMGYGDYALERHKKRFSNMVNDERFSTLWEDWTFGPGPYGGSTINHAWSGGGLILLSQYLCGISPIEPGYKIFQIKPQPATITTAAAKVSSIAGVIESSYELKPGKFTIRATIPAGTQCVTGIKDQYEQIMINGKLIWEYGSYKTIPEATAFQDTDSGYIKFKVQNGSWEITAYSPSFQPALKDPVDIYTAKKTDTMLCKNDTIMLVAGTSGQNFQWFKNDKFLKNVTNYFLNVWDSGYYYAVRLGTSGRFDTSQKYKVVLGPFSVPAQPVVSVNSNKELVANTGSGVQWYRNGIIVPGAIGNLYKPSDNALYTIKSTVNGCTSSPSVAVFYIAKALFEIDEKQYITLFPNPAVDYVSIIYKLNSVKPVQVSISALNGTRLMNLENVNSGDRISLDVLSHGVYLVTVTNPEDKRQYTTKLIK
ncbi:MAG: alpha-L-rhamnosidase C-terminal domain-containing protein [Bacteroidota bacterium]